MNLNMIFMIGWFMGIVVLIVMVIFFAYMVSTTEALEKEIEQKMKELNGWDNR